MSRRLVGGGFAAVAAGAAGMTWLHVRAGLDPVRDVISEYAFEPEGWLLGASLALFAAGAGMFGAAMVRAGVDRWLVGLVLAWGACMLLIGAFPTDRPGVPLSMSGGIHRYAAFGAFLAMPAAGFLLARRVGRRRSAKVLKALSCVALAALVVVVVPYVLRMTGVPVTGDAVPAGLTQRLVVVTEIGVLVILGRHLLGRVAVSRR